MKPDETSPLGCTQEPVVDGLKKLNQLNLFGSDPAQIA